MCKITIKQYPKTNNMLKLLILLTISTNAKGSPNGAKYIDSLTADELSMIPVDVIEDCLLNVTQLIEKYGYPVENYEVETEDGYLLSVQRIPNGAKPTNKTKIPVLLIHGVFSSSVDWIINGPNKSLGYLLADAGHDVWLGNVRGNFYSRRHVSLSPEDKLFWKFSWHEMGYYDLPAMISFITKKTGHRKINYIGHSQGTTCFFAMCSTRPEYNDRIILMHGFAPGVYLDHGKTFVYKFAPFEQPLLNMLDMIGVYEILPQSQLTILLASELCKDGSNYQPLCSNLLFLISGFDSEQLNNTMLPVYFSHIPVGSSTRQLIHSAQLFNSKDFQMFNYGYQGNLETYGSEIPPKYNISLVTVPVALYYADNDRIVDPTDVIRLNEALTNVKGMFRVPYAMFNHFDFFLAIDAKTLVYDQVISLMNSGQ